ncbi:hypothetical protein [Bradyrhizobium sp. B120]|uniref:hypothetical protein n=1 Tax=Bradyrhizobium sp. B120 TaxID=3410088 RepID=UPI003B981A0C
MHFLLPFDDVFLSNRFEAVIARISPGWVPSPEADKRTALLAVGITVGELIVLSC